MYQTINFLKLVLYRHPLGREVDFCMEFLEIFGFECVGEYYDNKNVLYSFRKLVSSHKFDQKFLLTLLLATSVGSVRRYLELCIEVLKICVFVCQHMKNK